MQVRWPARNREFGFFDALGLVGLIGFLVARFVPVAKLPFWRCWLRSNTGWPCLGCGLTRVADRLVHGNVAGAFEANPLGALFALAAAGLVLWTLLHLAFRVPVPEVALSPGQARAARIALVVAVAVNYAFVVVRTRFPELL